MAHRLELASYHTPVYPVLYRQLRYSLLAVNVLRHYQAVGDNELTTAVPVFIALDIMLEAIFYRRETTKIKAFFA